MPDKKVVISLEDVLSDYFYADDIKNILNEYGEKASGNKQEQIERFLHSSKVHDTNVNSVAEFLLSKLPIKTLKEIGKQYSLHLPKGKNEIVGYIVTNLKFIPYVGQDDRFCKICGKITSQEIYFKSNWEVDYFKCMTCNNKDYLLTKKTEQPQKSPKPLPKEEFLIKLYELTMSNVGGFSCFSIGESLGMDRDLSSVTALELKDEGLVGLGLGGSIYIKEKGKIKARGYDVGQKSTDRSMINIENANVINGSIIQNSSVSQASNIKSVEDEKSEEKRKSYWRFEYGLGIYAILLAIIIVITTQFFNPIIGVIIAGIITIPVSILILLLITKIFDSGRLMK